MFLLIFPRVWSTARPFCLDVASRFVKTLFPPRVYINTKTQLRLGFSTTSLLQNASRIIPSRSLPFERDDITRILVLVEMLWGAEVTNSVRFSSREISSVQQSRVGFRYRWITGGNVLWSLSSMRFFFSISVWRFDELLCASSCVRTCSIFFESVGFWTNVLVVFLIYRGMRRTKFIFL